MPPESEKSSQRPARPLRSAACCLAISCLIFRSFLLFVFDPRFFSSGFGIAASRVAEGAFLEEVFGFASISRALQPSVSACS